MVRPVAITSLPPSPDEDRHKRIRNYSISMSIRVGCFIAALFTTGWLQLGLIIGAIVLPAIAVVIANAVGASPGASPEQPGPPQLPPGFDRFE